MEFPVIWHIPHASVLIPEQLADSFLVDLDTELVRMTDRYTDDLFSLPGDRLVFPLSRLVCDVERFRNDRAEEMAAVGMGAVYTRSHDLRPLRRVSQEEKEALLRTWYDPHHQRFSEAVAGKVERFGRCVIFDCHSFSPRPLPYEPRQTADRPDICIGTDPYHTPESLARTVGDAFRALGYSVSRNEPYSGAIVPQDFYRREPAVWSLMIEVNRRLYMDEAGRKSAGYGRTKADIRAALSPVLQGL